MPSGENVGDVSRPFSDVNCTTFIEGGGSGAGRARRRSPIAAPITTTAAPTTAVRRLERRSLVATRPRDDLLKLEFDVEHPVEAPVRDLFQAALDQLSPDGATHLPVSAADRDRSNWQGRWIRVENGGHDLRRGAARKRRASRNHLVEHASEREDVAAGIRLLAAHLFRRHVLRSTGDPARTDRSQRNRRLIFPLRRSAIVAGIGRARSRAASIPARHPASEPPLTSMMLAGFRSLCTMPSAWAASSASAI